MPVYVFKCKQCGKTFEQKMTVKEREKGPPQCPKCRRPCVPVYGTFFAKTSRKS